MVAVKTDKISGDALGTGRRKTAVARVRVRAGSGKITVNGRPMEDYFHVDGERRALLEVLQAVNKSDSVDVLIRVTGGGPTGQAGACRMGLARALISYDAGLFDAMRDGSFLTRDSRMKERKKYGLRGARRGVQFSKR
jgi:small subunit ribosomal protein S9